MPIIPFLAVLLLINHFVQAQEVQNGFIDLSTISFSEEKSLKLDGEWLFVPNQFLDPKMSFKPKSTHPVPKVWKSSTGYGTYMIRIKLGNHRQPLGLKIPDIYSSYNLYINGQLAENKGVPGKSKVESTPFRLTKIVPLPNDVDVMDIVIHTSNFHHHKSGINKSVIIGDLIYLEHWSFLSKTFDAFIGGSLLAGCLFFLGLYFYGKHDKTSLFFALFCFTYAIRIATSGNHMVNFLIPNFPWSLQMRIEYGSLYLSTIFFGYFVYYLFPKNLPKVFINVYTVIALIFIPLTILIPPFYFTKINIIHLIAMLFGVVLVTFSFVRAVYIGQKDSFYSLMSITGFLIVLITKTLDYFNILDEILLITFIGQIIFFLSHALILSNHFSSSWRIARDNAEESAKARSNFLSVMSHEIRTPLNSVIGTTHHLLENNPRQDQHSDLSNLKVSSENLLHIVNNILDFNQIDSGNVRLEQTPVNLKVFIDNILNLSRQFASDKGLELKTEYDSRLPEVFLIDTTRLTQILTNLINNAIKFTDKGSVSINIQMANSSADGISVEFSVVDSGIGIEKDKLDEIFDPFQQVSSSNSRRYGGTGLGLTITKRLIEIMGSNLSLESKPGVGSRFFFTLKLEKSTSATNTPLSEEVLDLNGARILLVDDHELNLLLTKNFLQRWNSKVDVANDGQEAIDLIESKSFDMVLMDIQMPDLDGFETSEIIRSKGYENPIIAITADSYQEPGVYSKFGINAKIDKPFDPKTLYHTIKSHITNN